jgi:HD-GYP domain-containing protein (c-di-GMP phosphodiesterase class II)
MQDEIEPSAELDETVKQLQNLVSIGIALSTEKDRNQLLEMILAEARRISNADAGTLYLVEGDTLRIMIMHNEKMGTYLGGKGEEIPLPPVPIKPEYVSGYVALSGKSVNLPNIKSTGRFNFSGPREYDKMTGYRTVSMLVIPLKNHLGEIIGVLQLINAIDETKKKVTSFNPIYQTVIEALSSLAAIALTNMKLVQEVEDLFESFVQVMVTTIEARTPYNATHTQKVYQLAYLIAMEINARQQGLFSEVFLTGERLKQLIMAAWLHDIGKIAIPLEVMNKATRLDHHLPLVLKRIDYAIEKIKTGSLENQVALWRNSQGAQAIQEEKACRSQVEILVQAKLLILKANNSGTIITPEIRGELEALTKITFGDSNGQTAPLITPDELEQLSIPRGTLTDRERKTMEGHVLVTEKMLSKMTFPKKLLPVPELACMHHECIDGKGYPHGLKGEQIPLEARILGLADIFDALTASDRPYKKGLPVETALEIMCQMVREGKLDGQLWELFVEARIWERIDSLANGNLKVVI